MSFPGPAPTINASLAGVNNLVSYNVQVTPYAAVFCEPVPDPYCEFAILPGGKCNKEELQGMPTYQGCLRPQTNTNRKKRR